jgi:hypothetical protein
MSLFEQKYSGEEGRVIAVCRRPDSFIFVKSKAVVYQKLYSSVSRGPCKLDIYCVLFHLPELDTDLDCGFFRLPD